jgi:hypothetical protein
MVRKVITFSYAFATGTAVNYSFNPNLSFTPTKCTVRQVSFIGDGDHKSNYHCCDVYTSLGGGQSLGSVFYGPNPTTVLTTPDSDFDIKDYTNTNYSVQLLKSDKTCVSDCTGMLAFTLEFSN